MSRPFLVGVPLLMTLALAACGSGSDSETAALQKEVAALREQLATTTSITTPSTTTATEPTTTTTASPTTATTKAKASPTTTTTVRPTTTTTVQTTTTTAPTTTTTRRQPQGTVTWVDKGGARGLGADNSCWYHKYHLNNRSDTAVLDVTITGVYIRESYDENGSSKSRDGFSFPPQTVGAGIAPYGETDIIVKWCPGQLTPGTTDWYPRHDRANLTWRWVQ